MGPYLAQPNKEKKTHRLNNFKTKLKAGDVPWKMPVYANSISEMEMRCLECLTVMEVILEDNTGPEVSKYVEKIFLKELKASKLYNQQNYKEALIETFKKVDEMIGSKDGEEQLNLIRKNVYGLPPNNKISNGCGCTANVVIITPNKIITANAGDSRAALSRKGNAHQLSQDHKPENPQELKRIQKAGGELVNGRVNGGLNLSRSLGDFNYKQNPGLKWDQQLISARPDITEIDRTPNDQFIIMGCDGIWEKYVKDSQPLITRISNQKKSQIDGVNILMSLLDFLLANDTSEETGCDNMTAILIEFI